MKFLYVLQSPLDFSRPACMLKCFPGSARGLGSLCAEVQGKFPGDFTGFLIGLEKESGLV